MLENELVVLQIFIASLIFSKFSNAVLKFSLASMKFKKSSFSNPNSVYVKPILV